MPKIKVLPSNIANKIAAGEVVDRPASVVKELVENAIDAEAGQITVVIGQAGKELIQVIDNGAGMDEEDAELAFQRHATSKIADVRDLDRILTLGFRGEALPSIASVSRLEVKTCPRGSDVGVLLKLEGGSVAAREKLALKPGTTITVKNLFYNTPARRNFLRADTTELNHILKELKRFFLAYPEIHFSFIHNGEELLNLPPASQDERIIRVFDQKFYDGLAYVREELNEMVLEGYVCRPDQARGNSANQFIYLNRRAIINRNLAHAIFQGYGNLIERSRYPQFIMFLHIPPQFVDVNVHPTKMEVRFANERVIYHLFLSAVRKAIQSKEIIPGFALRAGAEREHSPEAQREEIQRQFSPGITFPRPPLSGDEPFPPPERAPGQPTGGGAAKSPKDAAQMAFRYESLPAPAPSPEKSRDGADNLPQTSQAIFWQVHNRYIISQIKSGLVIIDQHVAHERILYEEILRYLGNERNAPSQQLLFPQTLELALEDYLVYSDIKDWLHKIGFGITELSGRTVMIEAVPVGVKVGKEARILIEIIDFYRENEGSKMAAHEKIAAAFACKNAIKSGEKLGVEAMSSLVNQLFATKEPYFCPHGRPVIVTLDLEELDRKFKRI
ncbi:MAG: DNA mismatch repair endonuclease MutL [Calditrichaceae bacterium]|nr:DNA mismatch repair endonuclease MutL [Calditrichia bacterium]NUQ40498.1 DNA mismatch repair endonuclease MutL [Calditrichaceae bacterium]